MVKAKRVELNRRIGGGELIKREGMLLGCGRGWQMGFVQAEVSKKKAVDRHCRRCSEAVGDSTAASKLTGPGSNANQRLSIIGWVFCPGYYNDFGK